MHQKKFDFLLKAEGGSTHKVSKVGQTTTNTGTVVTRARISLPIVNHPKRWNMYVWVSVFENMGIQEGDFIRIGNIENVGIRGFGATGQYLTILTDQINIISQDEIEVPIVYGQEEPVNVSDEGQDEVKPFIDDDTVLPWDI